MQADIDRQPRRQGDSRRQIQTNTHLYTHIYRLIDWAVFNVPANPVLVIWETVLQVKRPNQQYQSTKGKTLQKEWKPRKSKQHEIQENNKHTQKNRKSPSLQ